MNEEKQTYFFDTYAFFEIINGNPNYKKYVESIIITSIFNLAELDYNLKKEMTKEKADLYTKEYYPNLVDVTLEDLYQATDLKSKNRQLSIPEVIGYTIAKRLKIKFLTGDEGFEKMDNVEYVKK